MNDRPRRTLPAIVKVLLAVVLLLGSLAVVDHLTGGILRRLVH